MKILLLISLLSVNFSSYGNIAIHTNDSGNSISLPDNWVKTIIGEIFYDADFVFTDAQTSDMLIVKYIPQGLIFNNKVQSDNMELLKSQLQLFDSMYINDDFFKEDEEVAKTQYLQENNVYGTFVTSQYAQSSFYNYTWVGTVNNHSILLKIITKSEKVKYKQSYISQLLKNLNLNIYQARPTGKLEIITSAYNYKIHHYPEITIDADIADNDTYERMNTAFSEEDRLSRYTVASQCTGIAVPHELLTSVVLDNFGYENSVFSGMISHSYKQYYVTSGKYTTSDNSFHSISAIIEDDKCQHVLAYIVESSDPLVDRFLKFIEHFETTDTTLDDFNLNLPDSDTLKYSNILSAIGDAYYQLKVYSKAALFYQQAFSSDANIEHFSSLLQTHYNLSQYQQGLDLIDNYKNDFQSADITIWKAWYLSKQKKHIESSAIFKQVFNNAYSNDEDFFEYLDKLHLAKKYQEFDKVIIQYESQVQEKAKLKMKRVKTLIKSDSDKAKKYIEQLFDNEQMVNKYQFELLDYLADIDEFQMIVTYSLNRIEQGYESAVLLNYLGDAQNMLGDTDQAYVSMKKAHEMAPDNSTIESYYKSLQKKAGKSDLTAIDQLIKPVGLPDEITDKIKNIKPKNHNESYEYLYSINAYHHIPDQKNYHTLYGKIKINNDSGVAKNKTVSFRFNQQYERAYINYFRVLDADGQLLTELDKSSTYITTDNDGITADADKLINVPVPSLAVGVMIEYVVTIKDKSTSKKQGLIDKLFVSSVANQYKAVVFNGDLSNIKVVKSQDLNYHPISDQLAYWDLENLANYKKTPYLPDFEEIFPWIKISTVSDNWIQLGDEYLKDIEKKINISIASEQLMPLYQETDDDISKAQAIISFVQNNISYQAIEFGWRAFIPNTAEKTLINKYGDCKDHAVLLYEMLNAANIKAQLALVNSENDIATELPSFGQFDHMIVYLPEIYDGVFIDVTDKDSSLNLLNPPLGLQGHNSLVLSDKSSKLIKIPATLAAYNSFEVYRTIAKTEDNYIYHESAEINGYFAASFREYLKGIELDELESSILSWVNDYYSDLLLEEFKYHNLYDNSKPLRLEFKFSQNIEYASIKLPVFLERYAMTFSQAPNRQWGFEFQNPFKVSSTTVFEKKSKLKFKRGEYNIDSHLMKWKVSSNKKSVQFNATVYPNKLPANEYQDFVNQSKRSYKTIENLLE